MNKNLCWTILLALCFALNADAAPTETVAIVSSERLPTSELASYLGRIYPQTRFVTASKLPVAGKAILVGSDASVRSLIADANLSEPESYAVRSQSRCDLQLGVIAGADARGAVYGVYALLEKLGCGFYLSCDALPPTRTESFSFDGWSLSSAPTVRDRFVFNWHNFLSGCSTWNLADWNRWTDQSQKQGYNGIMVHAYGNNPMVSFTLNGKTKPVGYLSTTTKGRDWSTMHVNDVRRLFGGEVFSAPVFGADAAQVLDGQRAAAVQKLMRGVFAHAQQRGMDVYFADDVDTISANPQELIRTLPEDARFPIQMQAVGWMGQDAGKLWLANPETPEGYRYYKAQVTALMKAYPQITCLVVWFRQGGTPWMEVKVAEMPTRWQEEWRAELARTPEAKKLWHAPQMFAIGKIVRAFDRALKELGHDRVQLASGTWDFKFLAPCHRFFPPHVKLIGLDYNALHGRPQLGDDESRQVIRDVAACRPVIPVIWAHHDDGNYIGRPYTPFTSFATKLADAKASGFGIIHWTTRPLDLYFKSHAEQVWSATKDRPLRATCDDMATRLFGANTRGAMGTYLERWVTDAPNFARETSDFFIDRPLTNITQVVTGCRERLKLIERVDTAKLAPEQRDRVNYFKGQEEFIATFFQAHEQFQNAQAALKKGDLAAASAAMTGCQPVPVIEWFAKFSSIGCITRGEQGLVVSINTRWLPHIMRLRQQLGLEPVRYNYGPTSHDPLAQAPGRFTFHFDAKRRLWQTLGAQETGAQTFAAPKTADEMCRSGIEIDKPITLALRPIAGAKKDTATVPAGDYRLRLLMLDPVSKAAGQRVFSVSLGGAVVANRVDVFAESGGQRRVLERVWPVKLDRPGCVTVTLTPVKGKVLICGAVLEPVSVSVASKP
ncbi:MAG: malectin domain-containing carbohydrate-binding protein [Verrucomicrobia bacterium]|nr:malectin domain-containing carbohydrate-binding protein [Verrucomicrobiota bacterium]